MSLRYPAMSRFVFLSVSNLVRRWCVTAVTRSGREQHCPGIHSALLTRLPDSAFVPPYFTFSKAIGNEIPLVGRFLFFPFCFRMERQRLGATTSSSLSICLAAKRCDWCSWKALRPQTRSFSRHWQFHCFRHWQTFTHEIKRCHREMTYSSPSKMSDLWPSADEGWLLFVIPTPIAPPLQAAGENNPPFNVLLCLLAFFFFFFFFLKVSPALGTSAMWLDALSCGVCELNTVSGSMGTCPAKRKSYWCLKYSWPKSARGA